MLARRMVVMILVLLLVFGSIFGYLVYRVKQGEAKMAAYHPVVTISSRKVVRQAWKNRIDDVGSLVAVAGIQVTSEVNGVVKHFYQTSGAEVKKGDPLFKLDDSVDQGALATAQAALNYSRLTYQRNKILRRKKVVSQNTLDQSEAQYDQDLAAVAEQQAVVAKKHIKAPFAGRLGIWLINSGQYISAGTAAISLQRLNPIYARFSLPEQQISQLGVNQPVKVTVDSFPGEAFSGHISSIDSQVDPQTRAIMVQATVANNHRKLLPGMFANIQVQLPATESVLTVPETAIAYNPYGDAVFVIKDKKDKDGKPVMDDKQQPVLTVHRQFITLGGQRNGQVIVKKGLKEGDQVVTSGQLKLREGVQVRIDNSVKLNPDSIAGGGE